MTRSSRAASVEGKPGDPTANAKHASVVHPLASRAPENSDNPRSLKREAKVAGESMAIANGAKHTGDRGKEVRSKLNAGDKSWGWVRRV